mmetsp:Transcript_7023/g.30883  ORF Transcript_7023/g.30883 Transcript_7023/m.30883 type:complete len:107 (-) Transcript_7023:137-457(-)
MTRLYYTLNFSQLWNLRRQKKESVPRDMEDMKNSIRKKVKERAKSSSSSRGANDYLLNSLCERFRIQKAGFRFMYNPGNRGRLPSIQWHLESITPVHSPARFLTCV